MVYFWLQQLRLDFSLSVNIALINYINNYVNGNSLQRSSIVTEYKCIINIEEVVS